MKHWNSKIHLRCWSNFSCSTTVFSWQKEMNDHYDFGLMNCSSFRVSYQNSLNGRKTDPLKSQKPLSIDPSSFIYHQYHVLFLSSCKTPLLYLQNSWWDNIYTSPFPCLWMWPFSSYKSDFTSSSIMLSPSVRDVASPDCVANWRGPWGEPELPPFKDSLCIHKPPRSTADRLKFAAVATGTRCVWSRYFCNDKQPYVISNQTLEGSN